MLYIFQPCSKAFTGVFILKNHYQMKPPNVALTSFYHSAQELRVAYFCQPHKMYTLWSLATVKIFRL